VAELGFCPRCGAELVEQPAAQPRCPRCDFVQYLDPKLAVAAVIEWQDGIVLGRRAIDPGMGLWSFPAGYVDRGEVLEEALRREAREELGVEIEPRGLVGAYSEAGNPVVLLVYAACLRPDSPPPGPSDETSEVASFRPEALPPLAFPHDDRIVADWLALRARGGAAP
jgi:8-oxo-dGTP diphosphatase